MPDFLAVPQKRRERATHDKARSLRRGDLKWIRSYVGDLDDELFGEPATVRFLDDAILRLAAASGWIITADPRTIAGRVGLRAGHVKAAIDRLVELGRYELIPHADRLPDDGSVQMRLPALDQPPAATVEQLSSSGQVVVEQRSSSGKAAAAVMAQIDSSLESALENASTRQEQEQRRSKASTSNGTVTSYAAAVAIAGEDEREIVNRLAALAARGDPRSAAVIRYECIGLPDAIVARAIESYRGRSPRPTGGGYVVNTLRALRTEQGLPDARPKIEREPELR